MQISLVKMDTNPIVISLKQQKVLIGKKYPNIENENLRFNLIRF